MDLLSDRHVRLAIVGSRRISDYGRRVIEEWMPVLVKNGVVTVSGLMTGVDETVHYQTLVNGGRTIGIAGWGIDWSRDTNITKLETKIVQDNGLILSEYKGETSPKLWMFPARNKLVAGYSRAVLVIEAAENSGSIITANWARKLKKKLLVVPGSVFSRVSQGANLLIKDGGILVRSAEEVLESIGIVGEPTKSARPSASQQEVGNLEKQIIVVLESGPKMLDELVKECGMNTIQLSSILTMMELSGKIRIRNGRYTES